VPHHPYPPPPQPLQQRLPPSEPSNPFTPAPNQRSPLLSLAKKLQNKHSQTTTPHGNLCVSSVDIWDGSGVWQSNLGTSGSCLVLVIELSRCIVCHVLPILVYLLGFQVWDLASGELKLSLTGHISTVRGLAVSPRHPYLFSAGEDKVCGTYESGIACVLIG
jgi:hypothetical protein